MSNNSGMSKNMLLIAKIEAESRASGARGYGEQVAKNDYSRMCVNPKKPNPIRVCKRCGKDFERPPGSTKQYCDECRSEIYREARKKRASKAKPTKCSVCGAPLMRVRIRASAICPTCLREKRRAIYEQNRSDVK